MVTFFEDKVLKIIQNIPKGKIITYSYIAKVIKATNNMGGG